MYILIIDDHTIIGAGLSLLIKGEFPQSKFDIISNAEDGYKSFSKIDYDLVVLDVNLPNSDAIELITKMLATKPMSRILMFSVYPDSLYAKRFLKLGAKGYLNKESGNDVIIQAVKSVLNGSIYMSNNLIQKITDDLISERTENVFEKLSDRELEVCLYIIKGFGITEIATILNLSTSTVGTHKARLFEKVGVQKEIELQQLAKQYNIPLHY
jgi:DNA-binding NarL/FixJ family response regulator